MEIVVEMSPKKEAYVRQRARQYAEQRLINLGRIPTEEAIKHIMVDVLRGLYSKHPRRLQRRPWLVLADEWKSEYDERLGMPHRSPNNNVVPYP